MSATGLKLLSAISIVGAMIRNCADLRQLRIRAVSMIPAATCLFAGPEIGQPGDGRRQIVGGLDQSWQGKHLLNQSGARRVLVAGGLRICGVADEGKVLDDG